MFSLILLLGTAFIFANPDLGNYAATGEYGYYALSDTLPSAPGVSGREVDGAYGFGASVQATYLDRSPWRHSIHLRQFEEDGYSLQFITVGLDYTATIPEAPIQLAIGAELGSGEFSPSGYGSLLKSRDSFGGEVHTEISQYFVSQNQVAYFFVRPSFRFFEFTLDGQSGYPSKEVNGTAPAIAAGIGIEF